jgi:amino-acid N-acetyltransferase
VLLVSARPETGARLAPRPATPADLAAVVRLLAASKLPTDGVAVLLAERPDDFVVVDDPSRRGEVVAVAGLERCGRDALLRSVAVREDARAHGVGATLVERLIGDAGRSGVDALYLLTTTAERWFPRFGFERIERAAVPAAVAGTVEFTSACPASAVVMARRLSS